MAETIDNNKLRFAGDVNIELVEISSISGIRLDISSAVTEIQIFEDLFKPCMSGILAIQDSMDLPNIFKFIGEEYVTIKISTPGLPDKQQYKIYRTFIIYKMDDRQILGDRKAFYKLYFSSPEMIVDSNVKLSKTYSGPIHEVVNTIVKKEGLTASVPLIVSQTRNSIKYTSNYWSPYRNLKYLSERAISLNNSANYLFFENRNGINFISMDNLITQQPYTSYTYDNFSREPDAGTSSASKHTGKELSRFIDYKIDLGFDFLKRNTIGVYGSKLISHDITTKKYTTKNYTMFDNWGSEAHMNKFPIGTAEVASRVNSNIYNYPKYNSLFNGFTDDGVQNWLQNRASIMGQLNAFRLTAEVPGRTDLTVGQLIEVQLYKVAQVTEKDTTNEILDTMFSGNYLISAINHRFVVNKHEIHLELIKDSLITNPASAK